MLRIVVLTTGTLAWIYSWILFRQVRAEHTLSEQATPGWLLVLMGLTSTALIATAILAGLRSPLWPTMAAVVAVAFAVLVVLAQHSMLTAALEAGADPKAVDRLTLWFSAQAAIRSRSAFGAALITGLPLAMLLAGATGLVLQQGGSDE